MYQRRLTPPAFGALELEKRITISWSSYAH